MLIYNFESFIASNGRHDSIGCAYSRGGCLEPADAIIHGEILIDAMLLSPHLGRQMNEFHV